jgi:hypothetical protein
MAAKAWRQSKCQAKISKKAEEAAMKECNQKTNVSENIISDIESNSA